MTLILGQGVSIIYTSKTDALQRLSKMLYKIYQPAYTYMCEKNRWLGEFCRCLVVMFI